MTEPYDEWGVATEWSDAAGTRHRTPAGTRDRLRALIGEVDPVAPGALVVRHGQEVDELVGRLHLEDGTAADVHGVVAGDLPLGYHRLDGRGGEREVIVVPPGCVTPTRRAWGWAAQLYAARSATSWGIGDLRDLADIGRAAGRDGAGFVMVNPLHAVYPTGEQQASPYSPTTRRFLNPIYLHVEDVPGALALAGDLAAAAADAQALNRTRIIDRDVVMNLKLAALERIWNTGQPRRDTDFSRWRRRRSDVHEFAAWSVMVEQHGRQWREWPSELRRPGTPAVDRFAQRHRDRVAFHMWLQWLLEGQLAAAAGGIGLISDLPIGFDPDGFDAWTWQDTLALDASVGAPPDEFNTLGQDWALPPFVPWRLRAAGYRPFVDTLRAVLRPPAGDGLSGIRIDHVLGLFRLWWVPRGGSPGDGGYVRGNADDLLGILALESRRSGSIVIGEDLGTVDPSAPERLAAANLLSYRVLWFEEDTPRQWPVGSLGSVTTHDLPTVAGLWTGEDLGEQEALHLHPNRASTARIRERLQAAGQLAADASPDEAILAAHRLLATAPSMLLTATLDDAAGEWRRPNIPGAGAGRPNWSLALPVELDELWRSPRAAAITATLAAAVERPAAPAETLPDTSGGADDRHP